MKTTLKKAAVIVLAAVMLALCFSSCDKTKTEATKVTVSVYDEDHVIFLKITDMEIEAGTTAQKAVQMLCDARSASYVINTSGGFDAFTFGERTISSREEALDNGNKKMYSFGWKLNDELMSSIEEGATYVSMSDKVLANGDRVEVFVQIDEVKPDTAEKN